MGGTAAVDEFADSQVRTAVRRLGKDREVPGDLARAKRADVGFAEQYSSAGRPLQP